MAARADDYRAEFAYDHPDTRPDAAEYAVEGLGGPIYQFWRMLRVVMRTARMVAVHNARMLADKGVLERVYRAADRHDYYRVAPDLFNRTMAERLKRWQRFAEAVGAQVVKLKSPTVAKAVAGFVREKHITQVVFGHSAVKGWKRYLYLNAIHKFLRDAPPVDVHIVTQQSS